MNNRIPEPGQTHPWHRFVALGDSYTEGVGDPEPRSVGGLRGWADRIAEELSAGQGDFSYANLAVRGMLLQQILDRQLGPALTLHPDLVAISGGGNDILFRHGDPDKLVQKMDAAVTALAATGAAVLLFAGPDWRATPVLSHVRGKVAIYNENLHTVAERHGAHLVDLWLLRALEDPRMWDRDRLHFSPLGHHTIAAVTLDTLGVPHNLRPLQPKELPAPSGKRIREEDLAWAREYLVPWLLSRVRRRSEPVLQPKRPHPGPVFGAASPAP